jgi:PAS domain S-box-containing protein
MESTILCREQHRNPWTCPSGADTRFRAVFDAVKDGMFISDQVTGRFVEVNKAGCAMLGYSEAEIVGENIGFISSGIHPHTLEVALENGKRAARGQPQTFEWQCKTKGGTIFWTEVSINILDLCGVPAIVAIVRDISERKRLDEELRVALKNMSAANDAKSAFMANMSHELRTPLNAIIGFSDLMLTEPLGPLGHPRYREYTDDIHKSGIHLLELINDILDLARLDAGKTDISEDDVSLHEIASEACKTMEMQAVHARVEVTNTVPTDLPRIRGDERRLKQVVLNLLSNAIKFTPAGGTIALKASESASGVVLRICDTGIGIAEADLPVVFERFGQVDSKLARKYEGTGLGLPLAKQFVELHDGTLSIESKVNQGTVVTIAFPRKRIVRTTHAIANDSAGDNGHGSKIRA